jgi:hypothetical protein
MAVFEAIGELFVTIIFEGLFYSVPVRIYEWVTGKDTGLQDYRTELKKFIKFSVAKKCLLTWETDLDHLKHELTEGLELMNEKLMTQDFKFVTLGDKTIIQPPTSISFYSFHFLVQSLAEHKVKTLGVVETARTIYTTYNDPKFRKSNRTNRQTKEVLHFINGGLFKETILTCKSGHRD